jgi:hypothetical protein
LSSVAPIRQFAPGVYTERHYCVAEIAEAWVLSTHVVRDLFANEPGVIAIGEDKSTGRKRRYVTLRIPESVVARVHARLQGGAR